MSDVTTALQRLADALARAEDPTNPGRSSAADQLTAEIVEIRKELSAALGQVPFERALAFKPIFDALRLQLWQQLQDQQREQKAAEDQTSKIQISKTGSVEIRVRSLHRERLFTFLKWAALALTGAIGQHHCHVFERFSRHH